MTTPTDDAQRTLEQRALRNVRALVDKIETTEEMDRKSVRKHVAVIVGVILVLFAVIMVGIRLLKPDQPARTLVVPPPATAK